MNLNELKTKLGDNFNKFFRESVSCGGKGTHESYGISFEVILHERDNQYMEHVIKIDDSYYQMLGSYDSWNGTSWEYSDVVEVEPVQVTMIKYQKV